MVSFQPPIFTSSDKAPPIPRSRHSSEADGFSVLSKTERLREIWKKTAKVRIAAGFALMAWSAVAASSWALAVAGWIAAVRAWMAWTGAFLAVDWLLRSLRIQKNAATVALAVGVCVGAILAMPAAEAFASGAPVGIPDIPNPIPRPSAPAAPPFAAPVPPNPLTPETVREIFSDIRADHPRQGFVTLEQSVRRIEWLARGVPLSESARLPSELPNVGTILSDPSWKIAKAMEKLWFVGPDSFGNPLETYAAIDSVARRLSPEQLERILLEAYGGESSADSGSSWPRMPVSNTVSEAALSPSPLPDVPQPAETSPAFRRWAPLLVLPLWIAGYFGYRNRKKKLNGPAASEPVLSFPNAAHPTAVPNSCPVHPALLLASSEVLVGEYGFDPVVSEDAPPHFRLPTPAGCFRAEIVSDADGAAFRFSWEESWKIRHAVSKSLIAYGEPNELQDAFRQALESAYYETAVFREAAKCEEFRNFRSFEFSRRDAAEMYRQLEDPVTVSSNRETGGFWFWSGYLVKDGIFRFGNLANPAPSQIDSTSVEFAIRHEHWEEYVSSNLSKAFRTDFSPGERRLFSSAMRRAERENPDSRPFPLAIDFFNWHKHPGAPIGPSGGDINHPDSASGKFEDSPTLPVVTFAIANEASARVREAGEGMTNARFLRGADLWGERDYLVTFWKLLRISDAERVRREAFVSKVWKSKAVSLGICDRNGRLLHLDRDLRTDEGVFEADLRPVEARIFDERE